MPNKFILSVFYLVCFSMSYHIGYAFINTINKALHMVPDTQTDQSNPETFSILHDVGCLCGNNLIDCKFVDGKKICNCTEGFAPGQNGVCVEICNETKLCENGGSCLQHVCFCLPGTGGPYCERIYDCENNFLCENNSFTLCSYSKEKQKAYCRCNETDYRFDEATKTCRSCQCTPSGERNDPNSFSYCEYQQGQKICVCNEGYAYDVKERVCKSCNCGPNSTWCEFNNKGKEICGCEEGYYDNGFGKCSDCNCGPNSIWCEFNNKRETTCGCEEGYYDNGFGKCSECSCGRHASCLFNQSRQVGCKCDDGYSEKSGKCEMCYCGENSNCTFIGDFKTCRCESGYEDVNGFCVDINECEKHNPCKTSQTCINVPGNYKCICKEGYYPDSLDILWKPVLEGCGDIDECLNSTACSQPNTFCENTVGSFNCICKSGFVSRGVVDSSSLCEEAPTKSIYIFVGMTSFAMLIGIGVVVYFVKKTFPTGYGYSQEMK